MQTLKTCSYVPKQTNLLKTLNEYIDNFAAFPELNQHNTN